MDIHGSRRHELWHDKRTRPVILIIHRRSPVVDGPDLEVERAGHHLVEDDEARARHVQVVHPRLTHRQTKKDDMSHMGPAVASQINGERRRRKAWPCVRCCESVSVQLRLFTCRCCRVCSPTVGSGLE